MGMVIIPVFILAFGIGIFAIVKMIMQLKSKQINLTQVLLGLALLVVIFGIILAVFVGKGEIYAFSPAFQIPLYMVFLPFVIYLVFNSIKTSTLKYIANIILVNIAIAGFFSIGLFYKVYNFFTIPS